MLRNFTFPASLAVLALGVFVVGCSQPASTDPPQDDAAATTTDAANAADENEMAGDESRTDIEKWLAQLSPEDRALAEAQKTCPISGSALGSMGPGIKVAVDGKEVFVCCDKCVQPLKDQGGEGATEDAH